MSARTDATLFLALNRRTGKMVWVKEIPSTDLCHGAIITELDGDGKIKAEINVSDIVHNACDKRGVHVNKSLCYDRIGRVTVRA